MPRWLNEAYRGLNGDANNAAYKKKIASLQGGLLKSNAALSLSLFLSPRHACSK
jgi:hypothetical protein